jgi:hypothetical protein
MKSTSSDRDVRGGVGWSQRSDGQDEGDRGEPEQGQVRGERGNERARKGGSHPPRAPSPTPALGASRRARARARGARTPRRGRRTVLGHPPRAAPAGRGRRRRRRRTPPAPNASTPAASAPRRDGSASRRRGCPVPPVHHGTPNPAQRRGAIHPADAPTSDPPGRTRASRRRPEGLRRLLHIGSCAGTTARCIVPTGRPSYGLGDGRRRDAGTRRRLLFPGPPSSPEGRSAGATLLGPGA